MNQFVIMWALLKTHVLKMTNYAAEKPVNVVFIIHSIASLFPLLGKQLPKDTMSEEGTKDTDLSDQI